MYALVEERSQQTRGRWPHLGPDTYVAVQVVPDDQFPLKCLNKMVAKKRGIVIIHCGEGWSCNQLTDRSSLNQARAKAQAIADWINSGHPIHSIEDYLDRLENEKCSHP